MRKIALFVAICLLTAACSKDSASEQAKLETEFERTMKGATLEGRFTSAGSDKVHEDKYSIEKVTKTAGDLWLIQARIQYGEHDISVPVPIRVVWAGDTPVLTMTDVGVPGMGSFTVRILIYKDQYAGTWASSKGHGGQMYGKITRR